MMQHPVRLVIVDDHEVVRKGLRTLFAQESTLQIVGEAGTVADALTLVAQVHPQLVLLDIRLPDASGLVACQKLLAIDPALRILVLSSYDDDETILGMVKSGAHGYVMKDIRSQDLINAIHAVAEGNGYLDSRICQQALHWIRSRRHEETTFGGLAMLSPQERLILPLLVEGKTNKEIAQQMQLSDKTVKNYLANIFAKLQIRRRTEAVTWYVKTTRTSDAPTGV